jgi:iron complex outermembrane receptor protein
MEKRVLGRARTVVGVFLWCCVSGPGLARATPTQERGARQHFEEGTKFYRLGDFERAIDEYKKGFAIKPDPNFLYNIAQSYRLANNFSQALFFYRSYLGAEPRADNRAEVEERIKKLEAQLAEQQSIANTPPNQTVAPGAKPEPASAPTTSPSATPTTTAAPPLSPPIPSAPTAPPASTAITPPAITMTTTPASPDTTRSEPSQAAAVPPSTTPTGELTARPASMEPRRGRVWIAGVVVGAVAVVGLAIGLGVGLSASPPSPTFGTIELMPK